MREMNVWGRIKRGENSSAATANQGVLTGVFEGSGYVIVKAGNLEEIESKNTKKVGERALMRSLGC